MFAGPIAAATPAPETKAQAVAAQYDPHLWASSAWHLVAAAMVFVALGLVGWLARSCSDAG